MVAPPPPAQDQDESEGATFVRLLNVLLREWKLTLLLPLVLAGAFVAIAAALPATYTSRTIIATHGADASTYLGGVAAQFGLVLPTERSDRNPEFYATLITTESLLESVVDLPLPSVDEEGSFTRNLVEAWKIRGSDPAARRTRAVERLRNSISVRTSRTTGTVEYVVRTREPLLSQAIGERICQLLGAFNVETRRSRAAAERQFIEQRLAEGRRELETLEESLQEFLVSNRRYEHSPELVLEHDRLQRRIDLSQQLVMSLARSYEDARIEEVRDTPVLTVVQQPTRPSRPDRRRFVALGLGGLLVGAVCGTFVALGREFLSLSRQRPEPEFRELSGRIARLRSTLRRRVGAGAD